MPDIHPIIKNPHSYQLTGYFWRMEDGKTLLDLHFDRAGTKAKLRFEEPYDVEIGLGFKGDIAGMEILDIRDVEEEPGQIEVRNISQSPGISFKAKSVTEIKDEI